MASQHARGRVSILRNAMRDVLRQYSKVGIDMAELQRHFPEQDRAKLNKLLWNMRQVGEARADRAEGVRNVRWFHAESTITDPYRYHMDQRRLRRARESDKADPLRLGVAIRPAVPGDTRMNQQPFLFSPDISKASLLSALASHVGQNNGVHARDLARKLAGPAATAGTERKLRQVITELRLEGLHICGTPEAGYYLAENAAELNHTCSFLYDRAMASLQQIARMKQVSLPDLRGQLHLPT